MSYGRSQDLLTSVLVEFNGLYSSHFIALLDEKEFRRFMERNEDGNGDYGGKNSKAN